MQKAACFCAYLLVTFRAKKSYLLCNCVGICSSIASRMKKKFHLDDGDASTENSDDTFSTDDDRDDSVEDWWEDEEVATDSDAEVSGLLIRLYFEFCHSIAFSARVYLFG